MQHMAANISEMIILHFHLTCACIQDMSRAMQGLDEMTNNPEG